MATTATLPLMIIVSLCWVRFFIIFLRNWLNWLWETIWMGVSICFRHHVLGISDGIENMGAPRWQLALALFIAWVFIFLCLCKGVKTSGKVCLIGSLSSFLSFFLTSFIPSFNTIQYNTTVIWYSPPYKVLKCILKPLLPSIFISLFLPVSLFPSFVPSFLPSFLLSFLPSSHCSFLSFSLHLPFVSSYWFSLILLWLPRFAYYSYSSADFYELLLQN